MPWPVPRAANASELAQLLEVTPLQLEWLADVRVYLRRRGEGPLQHYHRRWLAKPGGGHRLIETPKPLLKRVQRRVLRHILDVIPPHPCAHGFVRGRSALSHASLHVSSRCVLRLDLPDADLSPSGALMKHEGEFAALAAAIALDEGFRVNFRKTRRMGRGMRQRVCGIVVNDHPNVPRTEYDRLKATLTNCRRYGARSQNRERHPEFRAHLAGRVAWVRSISPSRGAKLQQLFDAIDWI